MRKFVSAVLGALLTAVVALGFTLGVPVANAEEAPVAAASAAATTDKPAEPQAPATTESPETKEPAPAESPKVTKAPEPQAPATTESPETKEPAPAESPKAPKATANAATGFVATIDAQQASQYSTTVNFTVSEVALNGNPYAFDVVASVGGEEYYSNPDPITAASLSGSFTVPAGTASVTITVNCEGNACDNVPVVTKTINLTWPPVNTVDLPAKPELVDDPKVKGDAHYVAPADTDDFDYTQKGKTVEVCVVADNTVFTVNGKTCYTYPVPKDVYVPPTVNTVDLPAKPELVDDPKVKGDAHYVAPADTDDFDYTQKGKTVEVCVVADNTVFTVNGKTCYTYPVPKDAYNVKPKPTSTHKPSSSGQFPAEDNGDDISPTPAVIAATPQVGLVGGLVATAFGLLLIVAWRREHSDA